MWMPSPSGRHAAIGALVGFGLGAAVGAKGTGGARATLTFGVLGGLLGAAFGCMTPSFHVRSPYRRGPWPYDEGEPASNSGTSSSGTSSGTSMPGSRTATPPPPTAAPNPGPPESATAVNDRLPRLEKLPNLCCLVARQEPRGALEASHGIGLFRGVTMVTIPVLGGPR